MNAVIKSEMVLLMIAAALFTMAVLQYNGTVDFVHQLHQYL